MNTGTGHSTIGQRAAAFFAFTLYLWTPVCWALTIYAILKSWILAVPVLTYVVYINGPGLATITSFEFPTLPKHWTIFKVIASYFPIKLHKTVDLDPHERYVFAFHPYGVLSLHAWCTFCSEACGFSQMFPGIDLHVGTLKWNFRCPLARELMLSLGLVDASSKTLLKVLKKPGRAVGLAVGGAEESLLSRPRTFDLVLKKRQGFVRIALQSGASLVPALAFGENDVWRAHHVRKGKLYKIQEAVKKVTGFTIPLAHGRGLFFGPVGLLPFQEPINVVVGAPISVEHYPGDVRSEEGKQLVDKYHQLYMQKLQELFDANKDNFAANRLSDLRFVQ